MADHALHLLDTNVLVALIRAGALGQHIDTTYQPRQARFKPLVSVVSIGEMQSLARQFAWGPKKIAEISKLVENLVVEDISSPDILAAMERLTTQAVRLAARWVRTMCGSQRLRR